MSSSDAGSDKGNPVVKSNAFPIDLAQKIALVKPTDSKGATVQTHQFRFVNVYCTCVYLEFQFTVSYRFPRILVAKVNRKGNN